MSNMVIQTNVLALNSHRSLKGVGSQQAKSSARLSSGYRINSAADDAAGLAISEKMRAQIRGLDQASKNSQDAVSLIQTAEGGMQEIDNMLQRVRELTVQVSNDTNENNSAGTGDRQKVQDEINQLVSEIDSMADRVEFNKKKVIDGSFADTRATLAMVTKEKDAATTVKNAADAKVAAYNANINTATTGTAALLTTAQTALGTATTTYNGQVTVQAAAEATYNGAKATYEAAKQALMDYADTNGLADPTGLAADNTSNWDTAAHTAVLNTYIAAANIWGKDDFAITVGTGGAAPTNTPTAVTATGTNGAIGTFATANTTFAGQTTTYNNAVNAVKSARDVDTAARTSLEEAKTAQSDAAKSLMAATNKVNAATEADTAGTAKALYFQVGSNATQGLAMSIGSIKSDILGIGDGKGKTNIDVLKTSGKQITSTLDILDTALSYVTTERSKLGAAQNRLEYTQKSLDTSSENLSAAESRIRDTDMAKEMMNLTKSNVLQQAATSMLAQANQAPQNVLQLLQ